MFGYVMPLKEELKVREFDIFKSYYCGLCFEIGSISQVSRLTLTYDMAFLAMLLSSVYTKQEKVEKRFCPYKMKKVSVIPSNEFIRYAAEMNILLSNRKLIDDFNDEKNYLKLFFSKLIKARNISIKAKEKLEIIDSCLKELSMLEKAKCNNIDETSDCFARLTSGLFSNTEDSTGRILDSMGYNIGKWIYIMDAYDDLLDDIRDGKYNPFIYSFEYKKEPEDFKKSIKNNVEFVLLKCLDEISKGFELLDIKKNRGIIENIVYLGMADRTMKVIKEM